jgi:hypothetical protein
MWEVINEKGNCRENIPLRIITKIIILLSFIYTSLLLTFCSREQSNQKWFESTKHHSFKISEKRKKSDQMEEKENSIENEQKSSNENCEEFESGGTEGKAFWKGWRKWEGKKPDFNKTLYFPFAVSVDFHLVWQFGKDEPNSPDGFLVIHIANFQNFSISIQYIC